VVRERIFIWAVLAFLRLLFPAWLFIAEPFSWSFYRAMVAFVAANPLPVRSRSARPARVLSGVARAARGSVLVKGGGPFEGLGMLEAVAFDETGTLTEGKLKLTDVNRYETPESELLRRAVAVESRGHRLLAARRPRGPRKSGRDNRFRSPRPQENSRRGIRAIGIAMGAAGPEVALENVDVALIADDLRHLTFAVGLSRRSRQVIRQNLWFSLGMVAYLIPATLFGLQLGAARLFPAVGEVAKVLTDELRQMLLGTTQPDYLPCE